MPKNVHVPLKVIKVPLDKTIRTNFRKDFPKMSRLYLELIENTDKIISDKLGKEFVPDYSKKPNGFNETYEKNNHINDLGHSLTEDYESDNNVFNDDSDDEMSIRSLTSDADNDFDDDPLTNQLKSLLDDDDSSSVNSLSHHSVHRSNRSKKRTPPTLDQLRQTGAYEAPKVVKEFRDEEDYEDEEDKKRELLFKFDLLKKSYKGSHIPEFSIHSDYKTMERTYEHTVKKLSLDSTVETYKTYLIGGFMVVEYVFGSWFKFDMQGFTQQQILSMGSYEKLLIELGEKSYVPEGSNWPVELRLLFLIIINAAFFIISKLILKKTGSNLMGMVNSMNTSSAAPSTQPGAKRKMKGPSINLDEIPEFEN